MFEYFSKINNLIEIVYNNEKDNINKVVDLFVNATKNKNSIYVFGASHAGIITQEMFYRAGGMININPIFSKELMLDVEPVTHTSNMERLDGYGKVIASDIDFKVDDILLIHSVSGRNSVSIDMALSAKEKGVIVIGISNISYSKSVKSRHISGYNLYQVCDICIDNHGDIGDACISVENMEQKVSPTSTIIGSLIVNTITSETIKKLSKLNLKYLPVFYSANLDGGDGKNKELFNEYKDCIHYKF